MNNKFDELTKSMAQSATRRQALKKFGLGLAGMALACFGLANRTEAGGKSNYLCCTYVATQQPVFYSLCVPVAQGCPGSPVFVAPVDKCTDCGARKPRGKWSDPGPVPA